MAQPAPATKIYRYQGGEKVLVRTLSGLPFGTARVIEIPDLGRAVHAGEQTAGSGASRAVVEVSYVLDDRR